ncbi:MAG: threonine/serine dehydratase [Gammaproteobacteria bacterium]|nr:threonine/serine dehydratase [Gammaproteobacteria bacterium]
MTDTPCTATPSVAEIEEARAAIDKHIVRTPVHHWRGPEIDAAVGSDTEVLLKLELFQVTGTFKPRGALTVMSRLDAETLSRGVTAVSAGNHAIAVAYAAKKLRTQAKVVMPKTANPFRVARCREYGAEVILTDDIATAFATVEKIEQEQGLTFVHPFEGPNVTLGTATVGLEFAQQAGPLDAVIVPVGGGGLLAGVAAATKQLMPSCEVFGIEPIGADSMSRSFALGAPQKLDRVATIADSLGAPYALPGSFAMCQAHVDEIVLIDDDKIKAAMAFIFANMKLAVEPAAAIGTAALLGPLKARLAGKRVGIVVCGSNIDHATFAQYLSEGTALLAS